MNIEELEWFADTKWQVFIRVSVAAGVWFLAFAAALAIAKWFDGSTITVAMCIISFGLAFVLGLLMLGAMHEAHRAQVAVLTATKATKVE